MMETEVKDFLERFVSSQAMYGEIIDVDAKSTEIYNSIYNSIRDYVLKSTLPLYVLRCQNTIFLSKNNPAFDQLYEVIKKFAILLIEKGILEIWDDRENKVINVIFPSIKRHFLVKYSDEEDKVLKTNAIMNENQ